MEKYAKISREHPYKHQMFKDSSFGELFPEWNKIIPYIKTEMSAFDMDKLIAAEPYSYSINFIEYISKFYTEILI